MQNRIKELRQKNHMSQVRLSIELEVSQETVSAYEKGKHYPSFQTLLKLSEIFHSSIDYIMGLSDDNRRTADILGEEAFLLNCFRSLNNHEKELALAYIKGLYDSSKVKP